MGELTVCSDPNDEYEQYKAKKASENAKQLQLQLNSLLQQPLLPKGGTLLLQCIAGIEE
jgi:hypothetical protein